MANAVFILFKSLSEKYPGLAYEVDKLIVVSTLIIVKLKTVFDISATYSNSGQVDPDDTTKLYQLWNLGKLKPGTTFVFKLSDNNMFYTTTFITSVSDTVGVMSGYVKLYGQWANGTTTKPLVFKTARALYYFG